MGTIEADRNPKAARVDRLIDENAMPIAVPPDSALEVEDRVERTVGGTGPTAWFRVGIIGILIVAAILLGLQVLSGGASTDMVPGTPTTQQTP
jgi:hypothetical protein